MLSSLFEASAVTKWIFYIKEMSVLEVYSIRQMLNFQKTLFHHGIILMKNINKTPKKIENVNDDGNK